MKSRRLIVAPRLRHGIVATATALRKGAANGWLMSALGHKRTYAVQQPMSALLSIATAKADFRKGHVRFTPE